jgi:GAF domain-containing protein
MIANSTQTASPLRAAFSNVGLEELDAAMLEHLNLPTSSVLESGRQVNVAPLYTSNAPPKNLLQSEKAWHRAAAYMTAKGHSQKDIAFALEKSTATVASLFRQPFFKQLVANILDQAGMKDESAHNLLKAAASSAAITITQLMMEATSETVRLQASNSLLDRVFGRPVQTVQQGAVTDTRQSTKSEIATLKSDVERLMNDPAIAATLAKK